jgi:hypothetical protein
VLTCAAFSSISTHWQSGRCIEVTVIAALRDSLVTSLSNPKDLICDSKTRREAFTGGANLWYPFLAMKRLPRPETTRLD